jgi:hypothetical protein
VNDQQEKPIDEKQTQPKQPSKIKKYWAVGQHHFHHLTEYIINNPATSSSIVAGTVVGTLLFIKFVIKKKK